MRSGMCQAVSIVGLLLEHGQNGDSCRWERDNHGVNLGRRTIATCTNMRMVTPGERPTTSPPEHSSNPRPCARRGWMVKQCLICIAIGP